MYSSKRLHIRHVTHRDNLSLLEILNDPMVSRFNDYGEYLNRDELKAWIQHDIELYLQGKGMRLVIIFNNKVIGDIGVLSKGKGTFEVSFELSSDYHGQGIMSEAMRLILDDVHQWKMYEAVQKITARVSELNIKSIQLLSRLGFQPESPTQFIYLVPS